MINKKLLCSHISYFLNILLSLSCALFICSLPFWCVFFFFIETLTQSNIYLVKSYCYTFSILIVAWTCARREKNNLTSMIQTCLNVMSLFFFCKICKNCEWVMIMDLWVTSDRKVFQFVHRLRFSWFTVAMSYISTLSYNFAFILLHFCHSLRWILQTTYEILNCVVCGKRKNCHFQLHTSRLAQNWICQISNKKRKWPVYYLRASTRSLHKVLRKFLMVLEELPSNFFFLLYGRWC